jgi:putative ABC transport system substrate-binding protein
MALFATTLLATLGGGAVLADQLTHRAGKGQPAAATEGGYRIGIHFWKDGSIYDEALEGIHDGLHLEGIKHTSQIFNSDRSEELAKENLRKMDDMGFDLIYSLSSAGTKIAAQMDLKTPIISTVINHPLVLGIKDRPNSNGSIITGTSYYVDAEKQLAFYLRLFPEVRKVGMIYDSANPAGVLAEEPFMRDACAKAGLEFVSMGIKRVDELASTSDELFGQGVELVVVPTNNLIYENLEILLDRSNVKGVPVVSMNKQGVENGALAGLFADTYNLGRQTTAIAKRILDENGKGKYPFEYSHQPDVILNLSGAQAISYEFPSEVLGSASIVMQ